MRTEAQLQRLMIVAIVTAIQVGMTLDSLYASDRKSDELLLAYDRITGDRHLMTELAEMFTLSESTPMQIEVAAFIIREPGSRYSIVRWPMSGNRRTETWRGPIPRGTIAVVHTHPNGWMKPSPADHQEATRTGLPFIVVTRTNIWVAEPDRRHAVALLRSVDWSEEKYLLALAPIEAPPRHRITLASAAAGNEKAGRPAESVPETTPMR